MSPTQRHDDPDRLVVSMTGVKMGDRLAQVGCAHGGRLAAVAGKVGLSGHAVAFVPNEASAARARKGAAQAGVLIEIETVSPTRLEADDGTFDLAVVDDTGGVFAMLRPELRVDAVRELLRILRPGGRAVIIRAVPRGGIGALFTRARSGPPWNATRTLEAEGFRAARTLAERDGLIFIEAVKARTTTSQDAGPQTETQDGKHP
jgi:ubiquinone/menaquinone biosynthesis C-methylase UbiE